MSEASEDTVCRAGGYCGAVACEYTCAHPVKVRDLKCFLIEDNEYVIAESAEAAVSLAEEHLGETYAEMIDEPPAAVLQPNDTELTIFSDGGAWQSGPSERKTIGEWIADKGRGVLCLIDY